MKQILADKTILITGASRGLGRAMALAMAQAGAQIIFTYSSDDSNALKTLKQLQDLSSKNHQCHKISVLDESALRQLSKGFENQKLGIDILINNAGVSEVLPLALMDQQDWDRVIDTNLKGTYLVTRSFLPSMVRRKAGVILNIGSLAGVRILAAPIHYCASKAGVKSLTEALCKEVSRYRIRVNCLAPGLLDDGVASNLSEERLAEYESQVALRRCGTLDEVAQFATFMVSDENSYMNGSTVVMDGGL